MEEYRHRVQYYETDQMGITHHSNYIRWMEEARVDYLRQIGWGYEKLEEAGILSPVTGISCRYRQAAVFPEEIRIRTRVAAFRGAVLRLSYVMTNGEGRTVFEGQSEHCFLNRDRKLVRLKKECPEFYGLLLDLCEEEGDKEKKRS